MVILSFNTTQISKTRDAPVKADGKRGDGDEEDKEGRSLEMGEEKLKDSAEKIYCNGSGSLL